VRVTPVSEFNEIREELDDLRSRLTVVELRLDGVRGTAAGAGMAAEAAERHVAKSRSEWREVVTDLEKGMNQILSLLTSPAACLPARRPEKTQSASDSPLT
jgi:hypothetical protein